MRSSFIEGRDVAMTKRHAQSLLYDVRRTPNGDVHRVLGIETSCDETAVAVVMDGTTIASNVVASSLEEHRPYGGVVPEIACRAHLENLPAVLEVALREAGCTLRELDGIAVTNRPGLVGALLVGVNFASALALACELPLVGVDHLAAHLYAAFMEPGPPPCPCVGLIVSGGHTLLVHMERPTRAVWLGETQDDAVGEAFDKVAKLLNLGYPGGPVVEARARTGNPQALALPRCALDDGLNFSFSGLKTAVRYALQEPRRRGSLDARTVNDVAAAFQEAAVDLLVEKTLRACRETRSRDVVVGGGVAANGRLRERLGAATQPLGIRVHIPPQRLCVDNAAMVAGLGWALLREGRRDLPGLAAAANSRLGREEPPPSPTISMESGVSLLQELGVS